MNMVVILEVSKGELIDREQMIKDHQKQKSGG